MNSQPVRVLEKSPRQRLEAYLDSLRRRIRTLIYARAAAVFAAGLLLVTALSVWALNRSGFPAHLATIGRLFLLLLAAVVGMVLLWRPLRRLRFNNGAAEFEQRLPAQRGRIETYLDVRRREAEGVESPLADLLAGDAAALTEATPVRDVIPAPRIWGGAAIALVAAAVLLFLLIAGPAHWGYGSRHLLMGAALPRVAVPVRQITVSPGDVTVRRNSDLAIRASVQGFTPDQTQIFVRFDEEQRWQQAPMQVIRNGDSAVWEFKLYALRGPLHYYVTAENKRGAERSTQHSVSVVDLPRIERVRLTSTYPQWTGLAAHTEESSRNIRAVTGTNVKLEVFADAPLDSPTIVVDGNAADMHEAGDAATGNIDVTKAGSYHISARVAGELVALTDDYSIEIVADEKPSVDIQKPGRDWRATSIEEVPVRIQAQDDFRLQQVELRYAVNGGDWQTMKVGGGNRQADSESVLRLEELGAIQKQPEEKAQQLLSPGDLVSYYAVAKDRKQTVQTDLFMVQVQPFERRFTQGQAGGGGGDGMGGEQGAISERQREILLATWNLQRSDDRNSRSRTQLEDSAKMLAELQATLAVQTRTLAERTRARARMEEDDRIRQFVESLERAANVMDPAAKYLNERDFNAAVPVEQQALQQLLRAEAAFRDVQVAMQRDGSGNGGEQASRNFTEMFELEMDVDKNHYETESQLSQRNEQGELDEAIRKLKELAERQEKLAQQANRQSLPQREQRWQQEQLRREAEDLRRRLAELSRSQNPSSSSSEGQASSERGGQEGQQVSSALDSVRQALEEMRTANDAQSQDSEAANRSASEASRNLRQALEQMNRPAGAGMADRLEQLAGRTEKLGDEQRKAEADLYNSLSEAMDPAQRRGEIDPRRAQTLVEKKQAMANELSAVQREMRDVMNDHRVKHPQATQRLGEALVELENANLGYRLNRSAAEVRYGRAREAAPREGLITEGLETLERSLRVTARIAATEGGKEDAGQATPEALLAELSGLRRALQQAQRGKETTEGQSRSSQSNRQSNQRADENQNSKDQTGDRGGAGPSENGLTAWNPATSRSSPDASSWNRENGAGEFRREAAEISERVRDLANRMKAGELTAAQISALRRMTHELRRLAGNPMAAQADAMSKLVDQIELTTLAAAEKSRKAAAAHTSASADDAPEYREAVAEYYRRLGGS